MTVSVMASVLPSDAPISSSKLSNCHWSGASTAPSREWNRPAVTLRMMFPLDLAARPVAAFTDTTNGTERDRHGMRDFSGRTAMTTVAVIGPGAIGGVAAAWLAQGGHEVTLCARTPLSDLVVETPDGPLR